MKWYFSQEWAKRGHEKYLKRLFRFVKGNYSCKDLLIRVYFYKNSSRIEHKYYGWYENVFNFHFYSGEKKLVQNGQGKSHPHTIELRINFPKCKERDIVELMAHEFRHYMQWRRKTRMPRTEADARDWARKIVGKFDKCT